VRNTADEVIQSEGVVTKFEERTNQRAQFKGGCGLFTKLSNFVSSEIKEKIED